MKDLLLTLTLTLLIGGQSTFAADTAQSRSRYRFARLEATETSWDHTSIIYSITDTEGHPVEVAPAQISYIVRDKSGADISAGRGIFVTINDTKLESEEDYSITIIATVRKQCATQTIYRKASPKKLQLKQLGTAFGYEVVRAKYTDHDTYEALNVNTASMSVSVAYAHCKDCSAAMGDSGISRTTLTNSDSYKAFENTVREMTSAGGKVQLILQPTITHKGTQMKYAQSFYEVTPTAVQEVSVEPATAADKEVAE